jgi:nitrite reductase (NADH) small subunit
MSDWIAIGRVEDIPLLGARVVTTAQGPVAVFRAADGTVFALHDRCPHRQGPLSEGIVHDRKVTCPLHNWIIDLESGQAQAPDEGCVPTVPVRVVAGEVRLLLPGTAGMGHG